MNSEKSYKEFIYKCCTVNYNFSSINLKSNKVAYLKFENPNEASIN